VGIRLGSNSACYIFFVSGACVNHGQYSAEMDEPSTKLLLLKPMIE
jgi:hypothetical protein